MAESIFRKKSLERLSSPEQIDRLLAVGNVKSWLITLGVLFCIAGCILWSFLGELPIYIKGSGMLLHGDGVSFIYSEFSGVVERSYLLEFGTVEKGDVIAVLRNEEAGIVREIKTMHAGQIMEIFANPGDYISAGDMVASVENENIDLSAVLYVPMSQGKKISRRMQVNLELPSVNKEEYGYLQGWVKMFSFYPVSRSSVAKTLGNSELASKICGDEPVIKVAVELLRDLTNEDDFVWTSRKKLPYKLSGGTECSGLILIGTSKPIELLFPRIN